SGDEDAPGENGPSDPGDSTELGAAAGAVPGGSITVEGTSVGRAGSDDPGVVGEVSPGVPGPGSPSPGPVVPGVVGSVGDVGEVGLVPPGEVVEPPVSSGPGSVVSDVDSSPGRGSSSPGTPWGPE